jgi:TP901 family phage tail tape measure protein
MASSGGNVTKEFKSMEDAADAAFGNVENGAGSAADALGKAASSTDYWTDAIGNYDKEAMEAVYTTQELVDMGFKSEDALAAEAEAANNAADKMDQFSEEADESAQKAKKFGDETTNAVSELDSLLAAAGITVALKEIAAGFEECTQKGEAFETSIAKLQTIAGGDMIDTLQSEVMELSNNTGTLADSLSDVAYNAISSGTAVEESVDMAKTASELAVAGFTDSSSALSVLTTAINAYGEEAGTAEEISDSLIQVQNLGVTTVAELAAQMGKAIASASAYNVSLGNLESAYISTTKAGINTAESTTYISSMLKELGDSGTDVSNIITQQTGMSFGQLMSSGASLADVLDILYESVNGDGEALMNLWSSAEAGKAANAILSQGLEEFNENLNAVEDSANATADAYAIMADTTEYAHDKMDNAASNLQITIGSVLNPSLKDLYNQGAGILENAQEFANEHPQVVKLITALISGIAAFAAAIAAYSAAVTVATAVTKIFGGALLASPFGVAAVAIGAVTAAVAALALTYEDATDATDELTFQSREQEAELEKLKAEYEEAVNRYGKTSAEAGELALQIEQLNTALGEGGETIGEFAKRITELGEKMSGIRDDYDAQVQSNNDLADSSMTLVSELMALQGQTDMSDAQLQVMNGIVDSLNASYSDLGLSVDSATGRLNYSISDLYEFIQKTADEANRQAAAEGLTEILGSYQEMRDGVDQARAEAQAATDNYDTMLAKWQDEHPVLSKIAGSAAMNWNADLGKAYDAVEQQSAALTTANQTYRDTIDQITEYCTQLGYTEDEIDEFIASLDESTDKAEEFADGMQESGDTLVEFGDAVQTAVESVSGDLEELAAKYDEAYDSAYESFSGQYALWEEADSVATTSVDNLMSAMQSQEEYWESYAASLENLTGRNVEGLSEMVASIDDGSAESASALAAMASASDEKLQQMVTQYKNLQDAQSQAANGVADMETDFSATMEKLEKDLEDTVDNMNMEDDAAAAAKSTMDAYVQNILAAKNSAVSAAEQVSNATAAALAAQAPSVTKVTEAEADASGTTNSADVFVAGEDGPELIVGHAGSTVFPTGETDKIISAVSGRTDNPQMMSLSAAERVSAASANTQSRSSSGTEEKKLTISIEGSGSVGVSSGTDKESVWESVKENFKSAFMSLLEEEIYEEGAMTYEF